ncbi:MAG: serine/threonine-protein kinase [Planctomycetota bacterium]
MLVLAPDLLLSLQTDHSLMLVPRERDAWIAREQELLARGRAGPAWVVTRDPDLIVAALAPDDRGVVLLRFPHDTLRGLLGVDLTPGTRLVALHPEHADGDPPADLYPPREDPGPPLAPRVGQLLSSDGFTLRQLTGLVPAPRWECCLELGRQALAESRFQPRDGRPLHVGLCGLPATAAGPDRSPFHPGQDVAGYELVERLGRGSMGEVWRGRRDGQDYAVKLPLRPSFLRHLRQEGVLLSRIEHPNVARLVAADVAADPPYLVMELVEGQPLRALCRGTISSAAATLLCDQLLAGLDAIHRAGVLHLDLKPENVIVTPEGRLKIVDLGLGRATTSFMEEVYLSVSLASREPPVAGTLAYMSPEQRRGRELDARADLFAFGILLHELLSGRLPQPGQQLTDARTDLAPRWDVAVARLTHPDREQRPHDARAARLVVSYTLADKAMVPVARGGLRPRDLASFDEDAFALVSPYVAGMVIGAGYELVQPLGRGGFGEVWEARRGEEERVALKLVLSPDAQPGLAREAEVARRLGHDPGIPRLVSDRSGEDPAHVVLDLVRGRSLRLILNELATTGRAAPGRRQHDASGVAERSSASAPANERADRPLPVRQALQIFQGMARLVSVCAAAGVVHMDLKPEHFLVEEAQDGPPAVSLIDFGLAALLERGAAEGSLATRAEVRGTLDYMAPEQREGEASAAVDVYALGVCLFELLTLCLPRGPQRAAAIRRDVPHRVDALILKMLASEPRERPSVEQVRGIVDAELRQAQAATRARAAPQSGAWSWRLRELLRGLLTNPATAPVLVILVAVAVIASGAARPRKLPSPVAPRATPSASPSPSATRSHGGLSDEEMAHESDGWMRREEPPPPPPDLPRVAPVDSASTAPSRS